MNIKLNLTYILIELNLIFTKIQVMNVFTSKLLQNNLYNLMVDCETSENKGLSVLNVKFTFFAICEFLEARCHEKHKRHDGKTLMSRLFIRKVSRKAFTLCCSINN